MTEINLLVIATIVRGLCTVAAIAGAAYLAYHGKEGWGWLIFVAVCAIPSFSYKPD